MIGFVLRATMLIPTVALCDSGVLRATANGDLEKRTFIASMVHTTVAIEVFLL